jgi:fibronectin type 3 domain-containing protein
MMKHTRTNTKTCLVLFTALWGLTLSVPLEAADFLFAWKASSEASITAYRVYQRTGDSPYEMIDEVQVGDLDNPTHPSYMVIGLGDGQRYWFAATSISASGTESDFSNETCITVNGQVVDCNDNDENGTTIFISCFISTACERVYPRTTGR